MKTTLQLKNEFAQYLTDSLKANPRAVTMMWYEWLRATKQGTQLIIVT